MLMIMLLLPQAVTSGKSQYKDTITLTGLKSGDFVMFATVNTNVFSNPSITATNVWNNFISYTSTY